jgi:hypothetical protein
MNVFLDIDGVCSDPSHIIKKVTGLDKPVEDYNFNDFPPEQRKAALDALPLFTTQSKPFSGMAELSQDLSKHNKVYYLTARCERNRADTIAWLKKHNFFYADNVYFNTDKALVISGFPDSLIVEDYGENIKEILEGSNAICVALSRPEQMYTKHWINMDGQQLAEQYKGRLLFGGPENIRETLTQAGVKFSEPTTKVSNPKDVIGSKKVPMSCVPAGVMAEVAVAMFEGTTKYGRHNYRAVGVRASVYYDAAMRHLMRWWEGEDLDPDSGVSHVVKAMTSLLVLRDAMHNDKMTDDRPPILQDVGELYTGLNKDCEKIVDIYGHINPVHYTIKSCKKFKDGDFVDFKGSRFMLSVDRLSGLFFLVNKDGTANSFSSLEFNTDGVEVEVDEDGDITCYPERPKLKIVST